MRGGDRLSSMPHRATEATDGGRTVHTSGRSHPADRSAAHRRSARILHEKCRRSARPLPIACRAGCDEGECRSAHAFSPRSDRPRLPSRLTRDGWWLVDAPGGGGRDRRRRGVGCVPCPPRSPRRRRPRGRRVPPVSRRPHRGPSPSSLACPPSRFRFALGGRNSPSGIGRRSSPRRICCSTARRRAARSSRCSSPCSWPLPGSPTRFAPTVVAASPPAFSPSPRSPPSSSTGGAALDLRRLGPDAWAAIVTIAAPTLAWETLLWRVAKTALRRLVAPTA